MNAELKVLAGGMSDEKLAGLIEIFGEDGTKDILLRSTATQKSADDMRVAYKTWKADAAPVDDAAGDEYPPELLDALESAYEQLGDWQPITDALQQLASSRTVQPHARILTDSGPQSVLPTTKAYSAVRDPIAVAVGADQARPGRAPVTTKSTPSTMKSLIETAINNWDGR